MDAKTLKALKGSIAKWRKIADGTGADKGGENCPLCKVFYTSLVGCGECPIASAGFNGCKGTPYTEWALLEEGDVRGFRFAARGAKAVSDRAKSVAQKEVDFLESLLPSAALACAKAAS
jgi:hypothetical protein